MKKHERYFTVWTARKSVVAINISVACMLAACGGGGSDGSQTSGTATGSAIASKSGLFDDDIRAPAAAVPAAPAPAVTPAAAPAATPGATAPAAASTTVVVGRVTDTTNLTVKRARYDARQASVRIDYADSDLNQIKLGMVVEIESARSAADAVPTAVSISAHSFLKGRLDAYDAVRRVLIVNGVTINVPVDTVFEGFTGLLDTTLHAGDYLEVYGFADAAGGAIATRIERKTGSEDLRMTGAVANLNTSLKTFSLYGKTVSYGNAKVEAEDFPNGLMNGAMVRVKGTQTGQVLFAAEEIRSAVDSSSSSKDGLRTEQEGVITDYKALDSFMVNGLQVNAAGAETKGVLRNGTRVEVEGVMRLGVLVASKVESKDADDSFGKSKLEGVISNVNAAARSFQVNGATVTWNSATEFDDVSSGQLAAGMLVEVEGTASQTGLVASKIKLDD